MEKRPTGRQFDTALAVLLWFHEQSEGDGQLRDAISVVRYHLDEEADQ